MQVKKNPKEFIRKEVHTTKTKEELNEIIDSLHLAFTKLTDQFRGVTRTVEQVEQKTDRLSQNVNDIIAHCDLTVKTQTWDSLASLSFFYFI